MVFLITGLVLLAGLFFIEKDRAKRLGAEILLEKEKLAEIENQNKTLDAQLKTIANLNQSLEKKLAALEKEKAELNQKLKESEKRLQEIQAQVAVMSPDEMVQQTRRILKDNGVEKIDVGARFTLAAFRKNIGLLLEWEEFSLVKIPALEKKAETLEKANLNLQNQVFLWKESDRLWRQKDTLWLEEKMTMNRLILSYEKQTQIQKRQKWLLFGLGVLAGFGGHALLK